MLWGSKCCSGEAILLWGSNFALGRQFCSGEVILLWGSNFALGK
ncbi:MAG TPA: hypothetical protein PLG16_11450 [Planctomycetota bacterium]|nr:hypothetical protein [Planctomycetota bacterium]